MLIKISNFGLSFISVIFQAPAISLLLTEIKGRRRSNKEGAKRRGPSPEETLVKVRKF